MRQETELFQSERQKLYSRFADKLEIANNLNRKVVSFQANKDEPIYRWFRYKEGFSSELVKYFLTKYSLETGRILDPFAGAGTTLFASQELGWESYGIELLPIGTFVIKAREALNGLNLSQLKKFIKNIWLETDKLEAFNNHIKHISITKDAFPQETDEYLNKYLSYCEMIKDVKIQTILKFAAFTVLEQISYTRKDGQYLRWDYRSKRSLVGKSFDKGKILTFHDAVKNKLNQIVEDLSLPKNNSLFEQAEISTLKKEPINIVEGSCLAELPKFDDEFFDFIITSPPYCNRYDYTRTYALELVYLGYDNDQVRDLRQSMLSCTVENKEKIEYLRKIYQFVGREDKFNTVIEAYQNSQSMLEVNVILEELNKLQKLNNNNIPRMVKNYFLEMCFVIYEMSRLLKSGGHCVMVNDNVRYGGEEIPVDLILCEFAENFGLIVKKIFVLPKGKGNSSQQMGNYGRTEVRKCVYLWQKI